MTTSPQSTAFSQLHASLLKPLGFRKISNRSERSIGAMHQGLVCFSSRFNSEDSVDVTLEIRINHDDFFHLLRPGDEFPGLTEKTLSLLTIRVKKWWSEVTVNESGTMFDYFSDVTQREVLPVFDQTKTIEQLVNFCRSRDGLDNVISLSWGLTKIGKEVEARSSIARAIEMAPHTNARLYIEHWAKRLQCR